MQSIVESLEQVNWDFPDSNRKDSVHNIHPYPAKFIPEIPRTLINIIGVPDGTCVLDPFCGSGATLVEAQLAGFPAVGIDLNPIACLISKVKSRPLPKDYLVQADFVVMCARSQGENTVIPLIPNLSHWFQEQVQMPIASILAQIEKVECTDTRDALKLALSSILVRVSNQESDTRYAAVEKKLTSDQVYQFFIAAATRLWNVKKGFHPPTCDVDIINKNILMVQPREIKQPVGLAITSPPYPNAYEYWLYHKYRMYWLGYDPLSVRQQEIGARAHYFKKNYPTELDFRGQMDYLLDLLYQVVVTGGHICIVIGRSKIHGKIVDNAAHVIEIGEKRGLKLLTNIPRSIASTRKTFNLAHANIKTENILVFEKVKKSNG